MGNPVSFHLTGGNAHDLEGADALLPECKGETIIADKAYDADERVINKLKAQEKQVVIPPKFNRKSPRNFDKNIYKMRHLIENFFCKIKQFRAIATRYDKLDSTFLGAIYLTASVIWLN